MREVARYGSITAAAVAAALLAGGCGGGGGEPGGDEPAASAPPSAEASADGEGDAGAGDGQEESQEPQEGSEDGAPAGGDVDVDALQGGWTTHPLEGNGELLALGFADTIVVLDGSVSCEGSLKASAQPMTLQLNCAEGQDGYSTGTIESLADGKLTVAWKSGEKDVFLSSSELEEMVPTDLPELPDLGG
ncbi:hypothetical protein V1J52_22805 [Streptomyces sp. TRM 70351]|uniref:hypothetical protein n=1 Tax=Streptomyces sp. TRM 70351 TaxID=3116552 RepID=UPI002E7B1EFB|nr:hypothetical protein [Streptomyces sp. TRM 70351]MEE1930973.1 hypothetical protein [Streptomyces sp. TRM 70351]